MKEKKTEKIKITEEEIEKLLMDYYSHPVDLRFKKLLGKVIQERANMMFLSRFIQTREAVKKPLRHGFILKWQVAFLIAFIGVLTFGLGTAMAMPTTREKIISFFEPKGSMIINSDPSGAEVWVGPVNYGLTPLKIRLRAGEYELRFKKPYFEDYSTTVYVKWNKSVDVFATLTEYENTVKYSRDETWNLFQDPYMIYQVHFPYDWDYTWDSFSKDGFNSSIVNFKYGETIYTRVYYTGDDIQNLRENIGCLHECRQLETRISKSDGEIKGFLFEETSDKTHRNIFLYVFPAMEMGYDGYFVLESNSKLADSFVKKVKVFTQKSQVKFARYNNDKFGLSFEYPEKWELFEVIGSGYVQVAGKDAVFSVTIGGINPDADNTVKSDEVYLAVGEDTIKGVRRYYKDNNYYIVQANVIKNDWVYGIEYRYKDDLWIDAITKILLSMQFNPPKSNVSPNVTEDITYSLENVKFVSDSVFPEDKIKCGDGIFIEGMVFQYMNGRKEVVDNLWLNFRVKVGEKKKTNFPLIYVSKGHFVMTSSQNRFKLLDPAEGECMQTEVFASISVYGTEEVLWSKYFEIVPEEKIETGVEGVVRAGNAGVSSAQIDVTKDTTVVASGKSDAGGYFKFSLAPGSYSLTVSIGEKMYKNATVNFDVVERKLTYVNVQLDKEHNIEKNGEGLVPKIEFEKGSIFGYIHDGQNLKEGLTVQLIKNGQIVLAQTVTDHLGRFRFDDVEPNTSYNVVVSGRSTLWQRWEADIEGQRILPSGGTIHVEIVVG